MAGKAPVDAAAGAKKPATMSASTASATAAPTAAPPSGGGSVSASGSPASASAASSVAIGGMHRSLGSSSNLKGMGGASKSSWSPGNIALIDCKECHFVLMDAPTNQTLPNYLGALQERSVHQLVRCCEPSYDVTPLHDRQIAVHEMYYRDGDGPPADVIQRWLALLEATFTPNKQAQAKAQAAAAAAAPESVAVHCVAGLGRAPVLIAVALMERCAMTSVDAVAFIRKRRRGAFNAKQLAWLDAYTKQSGSSDGCAVM